MLTRGFCVIAAALLALPALALAAGGGWTPTSVRGVVVYLLDGKWEEVARGQVLKSATLRTLRSGRVSLDGPNVAVDVGPNSALQLALKPDGTAGTIEQYLGTISLVTQQANAGLTVRTGRLVLTGITGELSLAVADGRTSIVVESGTAAVATPGGRKLLEVGSYAADATGLVVAQSGAIGVQAPSATQASAATAGAVPADISGAIPATATKSAGGNGAAGSANGANNGNSNGNANGANNGNANGAGNGNGHVNTPVYGNSGKGGRP